MIDAGQLVNGVLMGTVLILLGLVPNLLQGLADAIFDFAGRLSVLSPIHRRFHVQIQQPSWFAGVGVVIIVLTLFAYSWH